MHPSLIIPSTKNDRHTERGITIAGARNYKMDNVIHDAASFKQAHIIALILVGVVSFKYRILLNIHCIEIISIIYIYI